MKVKEFIIIGIAGLALMGSSCNRKSTPSLTGIAKGKGFDKATFDYVYVEAIKQKLSGNMGEALKYFEQCEKMDPANDAVYYQMAQIVLSNGDLENGKKYIKKAVELDPVNIWYMMMLAGTYYQEGKTDSAIIIYENALKKYPEREELMFTLGNLYSENKKYDKASEIFNRLDNKYGINERSTLANVRNFLKAGQTHEALGIVKKLIGEYPEEILYNGLLAEIYREQGQKEKAMEVYDALMESNPDNPETQLSLCEFLIRERKYEELLRLINVVTLNENINREEKISLFAEILENEELIKEKENEISLALMVLEAAFPGDPIILLLRPELYQKKGRLYEAGERLEEIITLTPENYYAWEKLLLVYLDNGDFKNLEKRGEQCATKFNRSFLAKMLYATGAAENKNYNVALEEVRKAEILAGNNEDMLMQVLSTRADIYYRMKDYQKAFSIYEDALNKNMEDVTLLNNYAYYLAEQNIKLKEAERMARKVIEKEKDNYTFLDTYAWVLYKRGKLKDAEKIMQTIIDNSENKDAEYYEHMGFIKMKRKKCEKAVENWEIALRIDSTKIELLKEIEKCRGRK